MGERNSKLMVGAILVLVGSILGLNSILDFDIDIFFEGWWTLILIIPTIKNIIYNKAGFSSYFLLGLGVLLLLKEQRFLEEELIPKLIIALIFFAIGFTIICGNNKEARRKEIKRKKVKDDIMKSYKKTAYVEEVEKDRKLETSIKIDRAINEIKEDKVVKEDNKRKEEKRLSNNNNGNESIVGIFSSNQRQYSNEKFYGASVLSLLANVQVDIRDAIITEDIFIEVTCILGGLDIYVPSNIRVINQSTTILAEVESRMKEPVTFNENVYTLYLRGVCVLGGIELRK